ncbi:hypothetical protein ACHAQH_004936 [Verticillium albo-atrum]
MTTDVGLATTLATAAGITGSIWWAGACGCISMFTIPALIESSLEPRQAAHAWSIMFRRGAVAGPRVSMTNFMVLAYAAYGRHDAGLAWAPYLGGGLFTLLVMPFTLGIMMPTNNALLAAASGAKVLKAAEVKELLRRWQTLNFARGLFPLAGAMVALWDVMRE